MTPVPQPPDLPDDLPPHVVAYLRALEATIAQLTAQVAELAARLNQNASNSSKPPSSDAPHVTPAPPKRPSGTRRGGQPGHPEKDSIRGKMIRCLMDTQVLDQVLTLQGK